MSFRLFFSHSVFKIDTQSDNSILDTLTIHSSAILEKIFFLRLRPGQARSVMLRLLPLRLNTQFLPHPARNHGLDADQAQV